MAKDDYTINLHKEFNFPLNILRDYIYTQTNIKVCGCWKITDGIVFRRILYAGVKIYKNILDGGLAGVV